MPTTPPTKQHPTAVITGATKGLGRAIAETFARQGFDLFVCARTATDLEAMQTHWAAAFPEQQLHTFAADLSEKTAARAFAEKVRAHCSQLDVLVNNAGFFIPGTVVDEADGALEILISANLYSAYHLTRALLPLMTPHRRGHIFNMCSIAGLKAYPNGGAYTISKFALTGFSKSLREETKPLGIKVTTLYPGATWTDSWAGADFPEDRLMQANDIAQTVWAAYALSDTAVVEELVIRPQLGDL
ncbi:MAG: SDR family oxidoreductase [Saprospiraceae bacterium]|nr:SDR family oxidoreductase [Saprospiraceae bacterium]